MDVRREDLESPGVGRMDAPTGWELMRRLDRLEGAVEKNHSAVLEAIGAAVSGGYTRDYLDLQHEDFRRRLQLLEQHNLTQATQASSMRTSLLVLVGGGALTFVGNLTLFLLHHH